MTFDVKLSRKTNQQGLVSLAIQFPQPLTKALLEREYNRATITVTDDGLLIAPYVGADSQPVPELPNWSA